MISMHALEEAAFSAWPALEEQRYQAWCLRAADGYTKRANSANAISTIDELSSTDIDYIEAFYLKRGVTPVFRLASFCTTARTDNALIDRGYHFTDLSWVMTAPILPTASIHSTSPAYLLNQKNYTPDHKPREAIINLMPDAGTWLEAFQHISKKLTAEQHTHLQMLLAIQTPCAFAVIFLGGEPVCCGIAVLNDHYCGLFDIVTHPYFCRRGYATQLCNYLMNWGAQHDANTAFLQVTTANHSAIHLYENLGFRRYYQYWYRIHSG
ncbi:MAG: GNAT family N-acetyltransferase [Pseudomonadota bacterium]